MSAQRLPPAQAHKRSSFIPPEIQADLAVNQPGLPAFRLYWAWLSRTRRVGRRRPLTKDLRDLIFRMVAENPTGGRVTASARKQDHLVPATRRPASSLHGGCLKHFKVRDSALTKTICLESAKGALSVRPEPANLLTRSLPDSNSGVFFEQSRQHATRKHSVLEFWQGTAPLGSTGHNTSIHW